MSTENIYMSDFEGITEKRAGEVRARILKDADILDLSGSYLLAELGKNSDITLDEIIDTLSFESEENPSLRRLVIAIEVNLKKSKLSKTKPVSDVQLNKEMTHIDALE